ADAERESAVCQHPVHLPGKRQQQLANPLRLLVIRSLEENAVILVRMQGLFAPGFATEAEPGEGDARIAMLTQAELDDPDRGLIVEQGNDVGDLAGRGAVG